MKAVRNLRFEHWLLETLQKNYCRLPHSHAVVYPAQYPDLRDLSSEELERHWEAFGQYEGRSRTTVADTRIPVEIVQRAVQMLQNAQTDLPLFFDTNDYVQISHDLVNLSTTQLIEHYRHHGQYERRRYSIVPQNGGCIFLLNHQTACTGAPLALYRICARLRRTYPHLKICLLEPFAPSLLQNSDADGITVLYYCSDIFLLSAYVHAWNPQVLLCNSESMLLVEASLAAPDYLHKCVFYFHELPFPSLTSSYECIKENASFVASSNLLPEYRNLGIEPKLYVNNISVDAFTHLEACSQSRRPRAAGERLVLGMMGTACHRKGCDRFVLAASKLPQFDFWWCGGNPRAPKDNREIPNLRCSDRAPVDFWAQIDYFFLTSRQDPCPTVVIEALSAGVSLIVFDGAIGHSELVRDVIAFAPDSVLVIPSSPTEDHDVMLSCLQQLKHCTTPDQRLQEFARRHYVEPPGLFWHQTGLCARQDMLFILTCFDKASDLVQREMMHLICAVRLAHGNRAKIILAYAEDKQWDGCWMLRSCSSHESIGVAGDEPLVYVGGSAPSVETILRAEAFQADAIIFTPNKGTDIGPFLLAAQYFDVENFDTIVKLQSKSGATWRNDLWEVALAKPNGIVYPSKWTCIFDASTDLNASRLYKWRDCGLIDSYVNLEHFSFSAGTCFQVPTRSILPIIRKASQFYSLMLDKQMPDPDWIALMDSPRTMTEAWKNFSPDSFFNVPMHPDCVQLRRDLGARNRYELEEHGIRGLPDGTADHAMERVFGAYVSAYARDPDRFP